MTASLLSGTIQLDDVYWGGERRGGKRGRGSANKVPFVAAVSLNNEGHPIAMNMNVVKGFRSDRNLPLGKAAFTTRQHSHFGRIALFFSRNRGWLQPSLQHCHRWRTTKRHQRGVHLDQHHDRQCEKCHHRHLPCDKP